MAHLGTRKLTMDIGGTEVTGEISKAAVVSGDSESDFVTFEEAAAGGKRDYKIALVLVQDLETGSLWDTVWDAPGSTVACLYRPYGNAIASPTQPHYTFNAVVSEPDGDLLGGEANRSASARWTIEVEWELTAKPVKVTTGG